MELVTPNKDDSLIFSMRWLGINHIFWDTVMKFILGMAIKNLKGIILSILLSFFIAASFYIIPLQHPNLVDKKDLFFALIIWFLFSVILSIALSRILLPTWNRQKLEIKTITLLGSAVLGFFIVFQINIWKPVYLNFLLQTHTLDVIPLADQNDPGHEIKAGLSNFNYGLGEVDLRQFTGEKGWVYAKGEWKFSAKEPSHLRWQGKIVGKSAVVFPASPEGGKINVIWDNHTSVYSLNSPSNSSITFFVNGDIQVFNYLLANLLILLAFTSGFWVLFCLFLRYSNLIKFQADPSRLKNNQFLCIGLLAAPMILIWGIYWATYFPGIMSSDSVNQWGQAISGQIDDWAPAIHTIFLWLTYRIIASPGLATAIQVLFFSFLVSWGLTQMVKNGLPIGMAFVFSALFAFSPVNGVFSITLWKDVPYGFFLLCLTFQLYCIVSSHGEWLDHKLNLAGLGLCSALVMLFRHNGVPIPLVVFFFLLITYRSFWRKLLIGFIVVCVFYGLITGPIYAAFKVREVSGSLADTILLHHIGAHMQAGTPVSDPDKQFLNQLMPLSTWKYDCCCVNSLYYSSHMNTALFAQSGPEIQRVFLDTLLKNPMVNLQHMTCSSSEIYSLHSTCYNFTTELFNNQGQIHWIASDSSSLKESSLLPGWVNPLFNVYNISYSEGLFIFFWRPALALFIGILLLILIGLKKDSAIWLLLGLPLLVQSLVMYLVNLAPDFRYFYGDGLMTLFLFSIFVSTFFINTQQGGNNHD